MNMKVIRWCGLLALLIWLSAPARAADGASATLRVSAGGDIQLWAADGSQRLRGAVVRVPPPRGPLSPDGARLAYVDQQAVFVADKDGKNALRISPDGVAAQEPCWSPDGRRVAFLAIRGRARQVHVADADGRNLRQLTDAPLGAWGPQFGADGRLAYLVHQAPVQKYQHSELVVHDLRAVRDPDGPQATTVSRDRYINAFAWSPDGKAIAYGTVGALVFHDLATKKEQQIAFADIDPHLQSSGAFIIAWRPDGAAAACSIGFLGDRRSGGPRMFGDDEVFILPREGKPTWFFVGGPVEAIEWAR